MDVTDVVEVTEPSVVSEDTVLYRARLHRLLFLRPFLWTLLGLVLLGVVWGWPWIAQRFGWTTSFAVAAFLAVLGSICWLVVHPENPLETEKERPASV